MKKTVSMRIALGMLALTLMTSCFVSGTFAKYVTKVSSKGDDLARVAKWGVVVSAGTGDLFENAYATDDSAVKGTIAESVRADVKVVAPGTKNENGGFFSLTGTPEVAVNVKIEMTGADGGEITDVVLPAGTYTDYTGAGENFTIDADYHPVVFTLKDGENKLAEGTLAQIQAYLNGFNKNYEPGTNLAKIFETEDTKDQLTGTYTLSWAWDYGAFNTDTGHDQEDTYLGQVAAGVATDANVKTELDFVITITVTQID